MLDQLSCLRESVQKAAEIATLPHDVQATIRREINDFAPAEPHFSAFWQQCEAFGIAPKLHFVLKTDEEHDDELLGNRTVKVNRE